MITPGTILCASIALLALFLSPLPSQSRRRYRALRPDKMGRAVPVLLPDREQVATSVPGALPTLPKPDVPNEDRHSGS